MSNNKLWVKYKSSDGSSGEKYYYDQVIGLANDANVAALRRAFVEQRYLQIDPATVDVREEENGEMLKASSSVTKYFVVPPTTDSAAATPAGPGKSEDTALFLTLPPPPQQHNNTVSR